MKENIVYYSQLGSSVNKKILNRVKKQMKRNVKVNVQYILPNNELIREYKKHFRDELGTYVEINIETFDDILYRNFNINKEDVIREEVKRVLIQRSISNLYEKGEINYYEKIKDYPGFIENISTIISHFKSSLLCPSSLESNKKFYREVFLIYEEYEKIKKNYGVIDREDLYFKIENYNGDIYLKEGIDILIVDQFFKFTKIDLKILEKLLKSGYEIKINYPYKTFDIKEELIEKDLKNLQKIGFKIENKKDEKSKFESLGKYILKGEIEEDSLDSINIYKAVDEKLEVENTIKDIKEKLNKGVEEEEILVIVLKEDYLKLLEKIGNRKDISFDISLEESLYTNRVIELIISFISVGIELNFKENLLEVLNVFNLVDVDVYKFLFSIDFNDFNDLNIYIEEKKEIPLTKEKLSELLKLLNLMEERILPKEKQKISSYNLLLKKLLNEIEFELYLYKSLFKGEPESEKNLKAYTLFLDLLEDMESYEGLIGEISREDYFEIVMNIVKEEKISSNTRKQAIKVLNLDNNFGWSKKYTYVLGLSQDNFPRDKDINFFLSERNNKTLKKYGLEISNIKEKTLEDKIKLVQFILNTEEEITFSFTENLEEGVSGITLIETLNKEYNLIGEKNLLNYDKKILNKNLLANKEDIEEYILINRDSNEIEEVLDYGFVKYLNRKKKEPTKYYGSLMKEDLIVKEIKKDYKDKTYSPNSLEIYSNCPYNFLLSQILEIDRFYEPIVELDYLKLGLIEHKLLEDFYKRHSDLKEINILDEEFNRIVKRLEIKNPNLDTILKLESSYKNLKNFIIEDLKRIERYKIKPLYFEKNIKKTISYKGDKINLIGRIDRVDLYNDELIVIDYKRNSYNRLKAMEEGKSLEIPIYFLLLDKRPIVGLYGVIGKGNFEYGISLIEENLGAKGIRNCKIKDIDEFYNHTLKQIFKLKSGIEEGNYLLNNEDCSDYCIFKEICRKEEIEI